jgi:hypothetical protein
LSFRSAAEESAFACHSDPELAEGEESPHFAFALAVACPLFVIPQRSGGIRFCLCCCMFFVVVCFPLVILSEGA